MAKVHKGTAKQKAKKKRRITIRGPRRNRTPEEEVAMHDMQALIFTDYLRRKGAHGPREHRELAEDADLSFRTVQGIVEGTTLWFRAETERKLHKALGVRRDLTDTVTGKRIDPRRYYNKIPRKFF